MKKKIILTLLVFVSLAYKSQITRCIASTNSFVATQSPSYTPFNSGCLYDKSASQFTLVNSYIPTAATPTLFFRVNFIFIVDDVISSPVSSVPITSLQAGALNTIAFFNSYYQGLGGTAQLLPVLNPSLPIADTKIRFQLNNVYRIVHPNAPSLTAPDLIYPFASDNAVNIYFNYLAPTNPLSGSGSAPFAGGIIFLNDTYTAPTYTGGAFSNELLAHELGHAIGSLADHYVPITQTIIPTSMPTPTSPGNGVVPGLNSAYFPDDAAWDIIFSYECFNSSNPTYPFRNNNLMGNSGCRNHLSAKQIAAFHYLVAKGITKKFTQFANVAYPWNPLVPVSSPITLTGSQTFTGSVTISTLTIPSGANITINNATLAVAQNGKIIVEPGAKLILNNVKINSLITEWEGIEVRSSPFVLQPAAPVTSLTPNFPGVGLLFMNNCCIDNARIGLLVGKRNFIGSNIQTYEGSGIVKLENCNFNNNRTHVLFDGYNPISINYNIENLSSFNNCVFTTDEGALVSNLRFPARNMVKLFDSKKVYFRGCEWEYYNRDQYAWNDTIFGIYGYKTAVGILSNSSVNFTRFRPLIDYGIFLIDPDRASNIEDANFDCPNGIYINESALDKIVRNTFRYGSIIPNTSDAVGIYMQNSRNYKIENNLFQPLLIGNKANKVGIVINNSGPYPSKVYNNTFTSLEQGIWCQNQNYDPSTNVGLVMNCNDFTNVDYNIGVQKNFIPSNSTGIAKDQGDPVNAALGVRNTYNTPSCFNENKYYNFTPFDLPPQITHPNYQGTAFRVTPQPSCSDQNEILDIANGIAPPSKSIYCANTSTLPASRTFHLAEANTISLQLNTLNNQFETELDNGNTPTLLSYVNSNASPGQIKNTLLSATYLSDEVMQAYFNKPNVPAGHAKQVHQKNAPVSASVWEAIVNRNYPNGIFNQMQAAQNTATLSARNQKLAQISVLQNEKSYAYMHYAQAVLEDTSNYNKLDTLRAIIMRNYKSNQSQQLIELEFDAHNYKKALDLLIQFKANSTKQNDVLYADLMIEYAKALDQPTGIYSILTNDQSFKAFFDAALNESHPANLTAQNVLNVLIEKPIKITVLKPVLTGNNRLANQQKQENDLKEGINLNEIKIYPNPATKVFMVNNSTKTDLTITVYNASGQLIHKTSALTSTETKINCQLWPSGIYLVTLANQGGELKTQKLIVE